MTIRHIIHAVLFTLTGAALAEPVTSAFTYQGRLNHNGSPANGTYDLRFELYSAATAGSLVGTPVVLPSQIITGGLFSADLNFGGAAVFDGTAYWLAVSAKPAGTATYVPVPGRAAIRPTPYSIHSLSAAAVKDGAITSSSLANGAVTGAKLASSAVGLTQLNATGTPGSGQVLAYNGTGLSWITPPGAGGDSSPWLLNGVNAYYNNGNVGIGTTSPASRMTVQTSGSSYGIEHSNGTVRMSTYVGGSSPPGGWLGTISAHPLSFFVGNGSSSMTIATNGNVGIGTPAPVSKLHVEGLADALRLTGPRPYYSLYDTSAGGAPVRFTNAAGVMAFEVKDGAGMKLAATIDNAGLTIAGNILMHGTQTVLNGPAPSYQLLDTQNAGAPVRLTNVNGVMYFDVKDGAGTVLAATIDQSGLTVARDVLIHGRTYTAGDSSVRTLTIRGGADLAEPFAMSHDGLEPGTVVVIDDKNPGKLRRSTRAYDKKVAGIVSGANGIRPGISMIQEDKLEAGENVSLSGRVYVKAETSAGPIEPGDLLTTSDDPGLAMKAANHDKAQGAILGKAMTGLSSGEGMVLVLVTLQ